MKKGIVLVTVMMLFGMSGVIQAVETEYGEIGIDVDVTWVSKYIWRGFDRLDDKAAFQPSINLDLFDTGFSFNVWSSFAGASKNGGRTSTVNAEEWRYTLTYANSLFDGESYVTNYAVSWIYYDFPDMASKDADLQEFNVDFSWPEACPFGVVPHYQAIYLWSAEGDGAARDYEGFIHVIGVGYDLAMEGFLPDNPEQILSFTWDITYNDDAGARDVDHDWSHMLWGLSTDIDCGPGTLTPAIYYQTSMEDTVNTEDEFWVGISYGLSF